YSISLPDTKIKDAIWTYVSPYESVKEIAGHVAFYDGKDGITVMAATSPDRAVRPAPPGFGGAESSG
ncbi:MAG TPA: DUF427 domain-containing protein, partial [Solirubrobacteraceae bacterium]